MYNSLYHNLNYTMIIMESKFFQCLSKWRPLYDISCQLRKEVSCWAVLDNVVTVCGPAIGTKHKTEVVIPKEVLQAKNKCYLIHTHPKLSPLSPPSVEDFQLLQQLKTDIISDIGLLLSSEGVYKFTTSSSVLTSNEVIVLQSLLSDVCLAKKSLTDWYKAIEVYDWSFELHPWPEESESKDLSGSDVLAIWKNRMNNSNQIVM